MMIRAFSLFQMVLILGLLGILGLAAIVYAPSLDTTRLDVAIHQVLSDIEYAKQNASLTGVISGVDFVKNGAYTVYQSTTVTPLLNPATHQNMIVTLSNNFPNVEINNKYTVEFNSLGQPTKGGGGSVTLTNGISTRSITVTANTGKLVLQ